MRGCAAKVDGLSIRADRVVLRRSGHGVRFGTASARGQSPARTRVSLFVASIMAVRDQPSARFRGDPAIHGAEPGVLTPRHEDCATPLTAPRIARRVMVGRADGARGSPAIRGDPALGANGRAADAAAADTGG